MAENQAGNIAALLAPVLEAWNKRNEGKAGKAAGSLTFWRDGMLAQIETIKGGLADASTIAELKINFEGSEESVVAAKNKLTKIRDVLGRTPIGEQIDVILFKKVYGKFEVRHAIKDIIRLGTIDPKSEEVQQLARETCAAIDALNFELGRLQRMVND